MAMSLVKYWTFSSKLSNKSTFQSVQLRKWMHGVPQSARTVPEKMRVLCIDPYDKVCMEEFRQRGHAVDEINHPSSFDLKDKIGMYDAVLLSKETKLDSDILINAKSLKLLGIPDHGFGNVNVSNVTKYGVLLLNTEEKHGLLSTAEAEFTLSLLLNLARMVPQAVFSLKQKSNESCQKTCGIELKDKVIGIVGLGRIGKSLADICRAFGMKVYGYDKTITEEGAAIHGIVKTSFANLLKESDFLTFHAPLTKQTRHLLDSSALALCKDGVRIVSASKAGIIDETALLESLNSGKVAGAALDVFDTDDPLSKDLQPLLQHANVICTPNIGIAKEESVSRTYREIAEQMCDAWARESYSGVANAVFLPLALLPEMTPFLQLSDLLGKLLVQLCNDQIVTIKVLTQGGKDIDITTPKAKGLIQAAALRSIVRHLQTHQLEIKQDIRCSLVNSSMLALDFGIRPLLCQTPEISCEPLKNKITLIAETIKGKQHTVIGSVFGEEARVIQIDDFTELAAVKPEGTVLVFQNKDEPGAIAEILDILAESNINVANIVLGRKKEEKRAIGLLSVDGTITQEVLASLQSLSNLYEVCLANFPTTLTTEIL